MQKSEETDQFQVLEEKVDFLIKSVGSFRKEKDSLLEKIQIQEERIADLTAELENLKASRDKAKQRIFSLLEKIEQAEL
jgi:septal ring factor EnvC (AmiA/AmiB activator)